MLSLAITKPNADFCPAHASYHSLRAPGTLSPNLFRKPASPFAWARYRGHALRSMLERHRRLCPCINGGCEMVGELAGIVARTVDQGRLAPPHERSAHQVEARRGGDPTVMADHPF